MNREQVAEHFGKIFESILKEVHFESQLLCEWFQKNFPESDMKIVVDVDNIRRSFTITVRVLMGREMANDAGFYEKKLPMLEKDIIKPGFMRSFFKVYNGDFRKEIAQFVNSYYHQQQELGNADGKKTFIL